MEILQIVYVAINVVALIFGLIWLLGAQEPKISAYIFSIIRKCLGKVGVILASFILVILTIPAISVLAVIIAFITLIGAYTA